MNFDLLIKYLNQKKLGLLKQNLVDMKEVDVAEFIEVLDEKSSLIAFRLLPKEIAADVFSYLPKDKQTELSMLAEDNELVDIIDELFFDDKIDFLEEVPANVVKRILRNASERERKLINQFLNYPENSAGSLMTIEFVDLKKEMTVKKAMERIRKIGNDKITIYTCYVTNNQRILEGIISLRDLVLAKPDELLENIMETNVKYVHTNDDQEETADVFKKYGFLSMPVVDNERRLVGIITFDDIVDVIEKENTEDFQRMAAIEPTEEEYLNASIVTLARKRIFWLAILMVSATLTELINKSNEAITHSITALVFFMPMLTGTGGNAGSQASTLVIRGIALGEIYFKDLFKVFLKEMRVSFIVAIPLAAINFLRLTFLQGYSISIALTVVVTMLFTIMFAAIVGGILPLIAKKCRLDPAIMASPLITTIVDACSLLIYYNVAKIIFKL